MKNILAFFKKAFKILCKFICVYLGCLGRGTILHCLVELVKWHRLPQIICILLAVQLIMKADIGNISLGKMFFCKICCRTAANHITIHISPPFCISLQDQMHHEPHSWRGHHLSR